MGGGRGGNFGNTKGGRVIQVSTSKSDALKNISSLPYDVQKPAKSFIKGSSNNYNSYEISRTNNDTYIIKMENPGRVPGSKAIYYREVDSNGKTLKVYKETYDPNGNLVHRKDK